jgi:transcriptional regulator with XRE-family HTH domain
MGNGPEGWWAYVDRITDGVPLKDVAEAAGIDPSGVSRWRSGKTKVPSVEKIVAFARKMGDSPLNALVAVGYITPNEAAADVVQVGASPHDFRDDALIDELRARLHQRSVDQSETFNAPHWRVAQPVDEADDLSERLPRPAQG